MGITSKSNYLLSIFFMLFFISVRSFYLKEDKIQKTKLRQIKDKLRQKSYFESKNNICPAIIDYLL